MFFWRGISRDDGGQVVSWRVVGFEHPECFAGFGDGGVVSILRGGGAEWARREVGGGRSGGFSFGGCGCGHFLWWFVMCP